MMPEIYRSGAALPPNWPSGGACYNRYRAKAEDWTTRARPWLCLSDLTG